MTPHELAQAVLTRLRESGFTVYDNRLPDPAPTQPYLIFFGTSGNAWQGRYAGGSRTYTYPFRVMCVGRTTAGLRDAVHATRSLLVDWRADPHPSASPLWEDSAGPELTDGPLGDERVSSTLDFRLTTRR